MLCIALSLNIGRVSIGLSRQICMKCHFPTDSGHLYIMPTKLAERSHERASTNSYFDNIVQTHQLKAFEGALLCVAWLSNYRLDVDVFVGDLCDHPIEFAGTFASSTTQGLH